MVCGADVAPVPGLVLPFGGERVIRVAEPYLGLVECSSGRLDYFETISSGVRGSRSAACARRGSRPGSFLAT